MPKLLTLVKIMDRVLYRADGVTQISVVSATVFCVDSCRLGGDELLFSTTISLFHRRKIFSGVRCPLQIFRGQSLSEQINPSQTVKVTPKFFPHVVRFELKIVITLLLTEEKRRASFDSRLRLSIEKAGRAFENRFGKGNLDEEN